jgi:HK97 family phage portal protein
LRIGIFDGEMEYEPLTMPAADAQLIERMKFSVDDVSRWLGIPPHKLMSLDRSTNNNIEHQGIEYVQDSIQPRATMWEQETRRRLLTEEEKRQGMYTKMNMNAILRGDTKTRGEFYKAMIDRAVFSPADVLRMEDMNTYPGSEKHMMPQNFQIVEDGDDNA